MRNSEWDKHLRDLLGDYQPENNAPDWDAFSASLSDTPADLSAEDELYRNALNDFHAPGVPEGWEEISSALDHNDHTFDHRISEKVKHFGPGIDTQSWSHFLTHFNRHKVIWSKVIHYKAAEVIAVLLLIFTTVQLNKLGRFPFEPSEDRHNTNPIATVQLNTLDSEPAHTASLTSAEHHNTATSAASTGVITVSDTKTNTAKKREGQLSSTALSKPISVNRDNDLVETLHSGISATAHSVLNVNHDEMITGAQRTVSSLVFQKMDELPAADRLPVSFAMTLTLSGDISSDYSAIALGHSQPQHHGKSYWEFGIVAQTDYNLLLMPEDRVYTKGKLVIFPKQGLPSQGFGGGFSFALHRATWAVESGIIYSSKTFRPDRSLVVGESFSRANIEYKAMRMQLVSIPVQYRQYIHHPGRLSPYLLAGVGLHLITQSDIDIVKQYPFLAMLSHNTDPNTIHQLEQTIQETERITEHIRDGAPFSTKSFLTGNFGLGIEYNLTPNKTLFIQTAAQYQIPGLKFSNISGKHIRAVSLQLGVRTPLGS